MSCSKLILSSNEQSSNEQSPKRSFTTMNKGGLKNVLKTIIWCSSQKNPDATAQIIVILKLLEEIEEQIIVWSSGNGFNDGKDGKYPNQEEMEMTLHAKFENARAPCFGLAIFNELSISCRLLKKILANDPILKELPIKLGAEYIYDYFQGKPIAAMLQMAKTLRETGNVQAIEVANHFEAFVELVEKLRAEKKFETMTIDDWASIIQGVLRINPFTDLDKKDFLKNLGLSEEIRALFTDERAIEMVIKVISNFKPNGCHSDFVNILAKILNHVRGVEIPTKEQDVVTCIRDATKLIEDGLKFKNHEVKIIMDCEYDDWLSWVVFYVLGFKIETYIMLPAVSGEIVVGGKPHKYSLDNPESRAIIEKFAKFGKIVHQEGPANVKALMDFFPGFAKLTKIEETPAPSKEQ